MSIKSIILRLKKTLKQNGLEREKKVKPKPKAKVKPKPKAKVKPKPKAKVKPKPKGGKKVDHLCYTIRFQPNMGLTNMLYGLAALATYSLNKKVPIVWPKLNRAVVKKGGSISFSKVLRMSPLKGLRVPPKASSKVKGLNSWRTIKWARQFHPILYHRLLNRLHPSISVQKRVEHLVKPLTKPLLVIHPRLEWDWQKDSKMKGRKVVTEKTILTFIVQHLDRLKTYPTWIFLGKRNQKIQRLMDGLRKLANPKIKILHASDLIKFKTKSSYTEMSAHAFQLGLYANMFIGCSGSTFSLELKRRLKNKSFMY